MTKPLIFISHITEENAFALMVKKLIDKAYPKRFELFISSDVSGISAGDSWLMKINNALKQCSLMISLCSPVSVQRPWINYEAGAAWGLGKTMIPLLHSGLKVSALKAPLSQFQAIDISKNDFIHNSEDDFINRLFNVISKLTEMDIPECDRDTFYKNYNNWSHEYTFLDRVKKCIDELIKIYPEFRKSFIFGKKKMKIPIDELHSSDLDKLLRPLKSEGVIDYDIAVDRFVFDDERGQIEKIVSILLTPKYYDKVFPRLKNNQS